MRGVGALVLLAGAVLLGGCVDDENGHFHDKTQPDTYLRGWPGEPPPPSVQLGDPGDRDR